MCSASNRGLGLAARSSSDTPSRDACSGMSALSPFQGGAPSTHPPPALDHCRIWLPLAAQTPALCCTCAIPSGRRSYVSKSCTHTPATPLRPVLPGFLDATEGPAGTRCSECLRGLCTRPILRARPSDRPAATAPGASSTHLRSVRAYDNAPVLVYSTRVLLCERATVCAGPFVSLLGPQAHLSPPPTCHA